ncbi:hypothetical protein CKF59_06895, partial [Psittacicella gerlachiana]
MNVYFSDLVEVYRNSKPINDSKQRIYFVSTEKKLIKLQQLLSSNNGENSGLTACEIPKVGEVITLTFGTPSASFGHFFEDLSCLFNYGVDNLNNSDILDLNYYILSQDIASFDKNIRVSEVYTSSLEFLKSMSKYD